MSIEPLARTHIHHWHQIVKTKSIQLLEQLLDEQVVFHSPVVHKPQLGQAITFKYLSAALHVFGHPSFKYVRELCDGPNALLEFELELDGVFINGVDIIRFNEAGKITDFKVMLRPLKAVQAIHAAMGARLN
jgi:hypothetical protein